MKFNKDYHYTVKQEYRGFNYYMGIKYMLQAFRKYSFEVMVDMVR